MTAAPDLAQTTELGCRSLFRVNSDAHLSDRVHEQLYAWCKEKNWDADKIVGPGIVEIADGVTASLVREERQDGSTVERWRFHQDEGQAIWITQMTTLVDRNNSGWVWTDVSGPDTQTPGVPRLVRNILQVTDGLDGAYRLTAEPYRATVDDVDDIYNAIMDPDRRGFLFLAGADDDVNIPHADWLGFVSKLLAGTRGIASAYVLDAAATLALNARLPQSHRIREWAVRTFLPDPQLDDPRDGVRHRILTTARIVEDSRSRLRGLLARSACRHSTGMPLPHELVRIDRKLRQLLDDTIVDRVEVSAPVEELAPAPTEPETPEAPSALEPPTSRGVFAALRWNAFPDGHNFAHTFGNSCDGVNAEWSGAAGRAGGAAHCGARVDFLDGCRSRMAARPRLAARRRYPGNGPERCRKEALPSAPIRVGGCEQSSATTDSSERRPDRAVVQLVSRGDGSHATAVMERPNWLGKISV